MHRRTEMLLYPALSGAFCQIKLDRTIRKLSFVSNSSSYNLDDRQHIYWITFDYLSVILKKGLLGALTPAVLFLVPSPSFSVTTHSFTLPASSRPMKVALVL